ncbi:MAG: hypothetical protein ACYC91_08605 [Solirubrobacteraceae bacterium]
MSGWGAGFIGGVSSLAISWSIPPERNRPHIARQDVTSLAPMDQRLMAW